MAELVNKPGRTPWDGATGSGMNWRLATSELEAERRHLRLDGEPVILYSLLSPPARATANLLNDLYRLDSVMTVTLEWRPWGLDAARRKIRGARRHYFSKRYSMMAHVQETEGTASAMVDSAADVESGRLGNALVELETEGVAYGDLALTIALHGDLEQTERLDGDVLRIFAAHDAKAIREGYGQLPAWFCRLPAQPRKRQVRSVFVSAGAAACLAPIYGPPTGEPRSRPTRSGPGPARNAPADTAARIRCPRTAVLRRTAYAEPRIGRRHDRERDARHAPPPVTRPESARARHPRALPVHLQPLSPPSESAQTRIRKTRLALPPHRATRPP